MKNTSLYFVLSIGCLVALLLSGPVAAQTEDDEMLLQWGQFEVGGNKNKLVVDHKSAKHYRICVKKGRDAVPLKITCDNKEATVEPGDCTDFEAKKISVASGGDLGSKNVIMGGYTHIK